MLSNQHKGNLSQTTDEETSFELWELIPYQINAYFTTFKILEENKRILVIRMNTPIKGGHPDI